MNDNNDPSLSAVNLCICYALDQWSRGLGTNFTLGNCLFGFVKPTKNANPDKYKYSNYGIGFDSHSNWTERKCKFFSS